ncbi:hypothetical protein [Streptomyces sp. NPDC050560]|uniref:hypothetical protein n=1 Tax=Streptomyces sp. NPDC050560 TaxID=3365630 RepID=UPI0037B9C676
MLRVFAARVLEARRPRMYAVAAVAALAATAALTWYVRPASGLGYPPPVLDPPTAKTGTGSVSTEILDALDVPGSRAAETLPGLASCPEDHHLFRVVHRWTLYGVETDRLEAGLRRLRAALPALHWKTTGTGTARGRRPVPRALTAERETDHFSLTAQLLPDTAAATHTSTPRIRVSIASGCYRTPASARPTQVS